MKLIFKIYKNLIKFLTNDTFYRVSIQINEEINETNI